MTNKKSRIGICEWSFPIPGLGGIRYASELGIHCYQLTPGPAARGFPLAKKELQQAYLECGAKYAVDFPSIVVDALMDFPMIHPLETNEGAYAYDLIEMCINIAHDMKMQMVMTTSVRKGMILTDSDLENTADILQKACDYAADYGIMITNENYLDTAGNRRLAKLVNRPNYSLFYDTQNPYCFADLDNVQMISDFDKEIAALGQLHVKDGRGKNPGGSLLGDGDSRFHQCAAELNRIGFSGDIFIENFYVESKFAMQNFDDVFELVKTDIATVKQAFCV